MRLTRENIHALFNCGCPNAPQKAALGLPKKLLTGWVARLCGTAISDAEYARLMALKGPRPKGVQKNEWRAGAVPAKPVSDDGLEAWL